MKLRRTLVLLTLAFALGARAQTAPQPAEEYELEITLPASPALRPVSIEAAGYRVSAFEIKGRWRGEIDLPLVVGDVWTPEKQSASLQALRQAYDTDQALTYLLSQANLASVLVISVDEEKDEAAHTVKLTFRPLRLQLSLAKMGNNLLPIPRSASPTRYEIVPKPLRALSPNFGVAHDRTLGTTFFVGVQNDLLRLPALLNNEPLPDLPHHLEARFLASASTENFHTTDTALRYAYQRFGETLQELALSAGYIDTEQPLAGQTASTSASRADGGFTFKLSPHTRLTGDLGYSVAHDHLSGFTPGSPSSTTQIQSNRVLVESQLPAPLGGFLRIALWEDNGWSKQGYGTHQRLAARAGYAREIPLSPNQSLGIELIAGGGHLWGDAPATRRFFGGNASSQFLYDDISSTALRSMPTGPLIRSFGHGSAFGSTGTMGGDGFWHINANLSLPVRAWLFPLLPVDDEVRGMLRNGINVSGRSFLITTLKNQGLSREAARAKADSILEEIRPASDYIIDQANLYAVKPLLMFDAGGLTSATGRSTWTAAGGGVQLTIVTAKFELGYLHTLSGPTPNHSGNMFARLVFQNLF